MQIVYTCDVCGTTSKIKQHILECEALHRPNDETIPLKFTENMYLLYTLRTVFPKDTWDNQIHASNLYE